MNPLPCIVCGRVLAKAVPENPESVQPLDGVMFSTPGNYGSSEFDGGLDGLHLVISICDPCLAAARARSHVYVGQSQRRVLCAGHGWVGWEKVRRPLVLWTPEAHAAYAEDVRRISAQELGQDPRIKLFEAVRPKK